MLGYYAFETALRAPKVLLTDVKALLMKSVGVNWEIKSIQQMRLIHALAESEHRIALREGELVKFKALEDRFGLSLSSMNEHSIDLSDCLRCEHMSPKTSVGGLERPLLFPHAVTKECRSLWRAHRRNHVAFIGLLSEKRERLISGWIESAFKNLRLVEARWAAKKLLGKSLNRLRGASGYRARIGSFVLWSSNRGRAFPIKGWDNDYFDTLADTEFVLCPGGDYKWSYRFFEAVLCGAIPVVEEDCEAYEGFQFHRLNDGIERLHWSENVAEDNFQQCLKQLTLPIEELNRIISDLVREQSQKLVA